MSPALKLLLFRSLAYGNCLGFAITCDSFLAIFLMGITTAYLNACFEKYLRKKYKPHEIL